MVIRCDTLMDYNVILCTLRDEYGLRQECLRIHRLQPYYSQVKGIELTMPFDKIKISTCYYVASDSIPCAEFIYSFRDDIINQIIFEEKL